MLEGEGQAGRPGKPVDIAVPVYGYKTHISIDRKRGVIRRQIVTDAAANDGKRLREGLIDSGNTCRDVWGDTGQRSAENERWLKENGLNSCIRRKKPRGRPTGARTAKANGRKSKGRARLRPPEGSDGADDPNRRPGPRQGRRHDGEHGVQHGSIAMASRSSQNRLRLMAWCALEARTGPAKPIQARIGRWGSRNPGQIRPHLILIDP